MGKETLINSTEKRALAELTTKRYDAILEEAQKVENQDLNNALEKISKKLKIKAIVTEIANLESKKNLLISTIKELGFDCYHQGDISGLKHIFKFDGKTSQNVVDISTPAGREYYRMTKASPDIVKLITERDKAISDIWLATEKKDVRNIVETKIKIPMSKNLIAA